jgi:hypothetical protein
MVAKAKFCGIKEVYRPADREADIEHVEPSPLLVDGH